jgi:hypothetical protein
METLDYKIEKVEIDLTEKGLTELAKMLVQSGRMSAPSFTNWCSRVSPQASRWARPKRESSKAGKAKSGPNNTERGSLPKATPKGGSNSGKPVSVKDAYKLSGFKKAWPDVRIDTWKEVLSAPVALKRTWFNCHKTILDNVQDRKAAAQAHLAKFNLNEDEFKHSRAWFPLLPGKDDKELYDSITVGAALPPSNDTAASDSARVKTALPLSYSTVASSKTGTTQKTGDVEAAGLSMAQKGSLSQLVMDQSVTTGTSQQLPPVLKPPHGGGKNKARQPKKGKR